MADPSDFAVFVDDEGARDTVASGGSHPGVGHEVVAGVEGDVVLHLVGVFFDPTVDTIGVDVFIFGLALVVFIVPGVDADEGGFAFHFCCHFAEVRHGSDTGSAPGGPEFNYINLALLEGFDGGAFGPAFDFKGRSRVADGEGFLFCLGDGERSNGGQKKGEGCALHGYSLHERSEIWFHKGRSQSLGFCRESVFIDSLRRKGGCFCIHHKRLHKIEA